MFCCWLRACHIGSLHKGTALLNGFCLRISYLATVRMVWHSCAADRLCRASGCGRRRCRIVWHCIWSKCHSGCSALCIRRLHKGAALLRGFGLYRLPLCIGAVIRLSCGTGRLNGSARWILACRFSRCAAQNSPAAILHRCAAARMGFRLGMYGLLLLRILRGRAAHDGLRSSCMMIRRIGRCFSCRRRCHMARRTSGAGRHGGFARGVRLLSGSSRRGLRECARHLFGDGFIVRYSYCTTALRAMQSRRDACGGFILKDVSLFYRRRIPAAKAYRFASSSKACWRVRWTVLGVRSILAAISL